MYNAQAGSSSSSAHTNSHLYTVPGELTVVELLHTHDIPATRGPYDSTQPPAPSSGQPYNIERVDNLMTLADPPPGEKPAHAYSTMIRAAILGTQDKRLLLEDIYAAIESRFPFFSTAGAGWKNSVRHNLSLNPCFIKVPRPLTDPGKGSYWVVDEEVDPKTGMQRVRNKNGGAGKRGSRKKKVEPVEIDELAGDEDGTGEPSAEEPAPYDPLRPAFVNPKDMAMLPVLDAQGHMVWKNVWRNELTRLRIFSQEQDAHGIREDLWQQLVFGVRNTLSTLVPGDPENMQLQHAIQIPMPLHHPPAES